ncbi:P-loop containing nucleoside triphosphate hydrolase protein, partial [Baffinella frigidus]
VVRLLKDLAPILKRGEKAVVFSQHKAAIAHLAVVFAEEGLRFSKIAAGDSLAEQELRLKISKITAGDSLASLAEQEAAVGVFNTDKKVGVFLLHAGQAAAGLTLTAASHVMLLEPFLKAGEEAQALNRCHRIGQTRDVHATHYYAQGTLEERLEVLRIKEAQ